MVSENLKIGSATLCDRAPLRTISRWRIGRGPGVRQRSRLGNPRGEPAPGGSSCSERSQRLEYTEPARVSRNRVTLQVHNYRAPASRRNS